MTMSIYNLVEKPNASNNTWLHWFELKLDSFILIVSVVDIALR